MDYLVVFLGGVFLGYGVFLAFKDATTVIVKPGKGVVKAFKSREKARVDCNTIENSTEFEGLYPKKDNSNNDRGEESEENNTIPVNKDSNENTTKENNIIENEIDVEVSKLENNDADSIFNTNESDSSSLEEDSDTNNNNENDTIEEISNLENSQIAFFDDEIDDEVEKDFNDEAEEEGIADDEYEVTKEKEESPILSKFDDLDGSKLRHLNKKIFNSEAYSIEINNEQQDIRNFLKLHNVDSYTLYNEYNQFKTKEK